jgi:hypothetical protein
VNSGYNRHLEWLVGLSDTILKGDHPSTLSAKFGLILFSGFIEDLNVIFYQNMPNLHTTYDGRTKTDAR